MDAGTVVEAKIHDTVSSLVIVPPAVDRKSHGYGLAASMISDEPRSQELVRRGEHPDLLLLAPSAGKETVGIGQVRTVIRSAQFTPMQGKCKVCLIPWAEALTLEAANALLKLLEEPPRQLRFLILAEHPSDVLPTILSRSRVVRGAVPGVWRRLGQLAAAGYNEEERRYLQRAVRCEDELEPFLKTKSDLATLREQARCQLDAAGDDALIAGVAGEDPVLRYEGVLALVRRLMSGEQDLATTAAVKLARKGKGAVSGLLGDCLHVGYGLLCRELGEAPSGAVEEDLLPVLARPVGVEALLSLLRSIEDTHLAVERYAPLEACLLVVFLEMARGDDV